MTTIAWDGKTLSADSLVTNEDHVFGYANKIHQLKDGRIFAAAGAMDFIHAVKNWLDGGEKPEIKADDSFIGIVVSQNKEAFEISQNLRMWPAVLPWAGGTGEQMALTAMLCGKNSVESVAIAIEIDIYSGGKINSVELE